MEEHMFEGTRIAAPGWCRPLGVGGRGSTVLTRQWKLRVSFVIPMPGTLSLEFTEPEVWETPYGGISSDPFLSVALGVKV